MKNIAFPFSAVAALLFAAGCATVPQPAHDTLISHRGESFDAPENTLPAYRTAVERGFGFECDIYLSRDGRVFTFHDRDLKRTTAGANTNRCADVTWDELSKLDVGGWGKWKGSKFEGTRPALLEEVLELARDGRRIYVEVKTGPEIVPYVKDIFAKQFRATPKNTLFISFNSASCRALKAAMPEYKVYWLTGCREGMTPEGVIDGIRGAAADGVDCQYNRKVITEDFVRKVREAGYEFHVWTVDRLEDTVEAFRRGAQTVTTNCAKKQLDEWQAAGAQGCETDDAMFLAVRGRLPAYTIVVPAAASPSQKYAAEELRDFTEKTTGVRLPIATDDSPLPERAILLGVTKYTEKLAGRGGSGVDGLGLDGFRLVARPPHLLVVGSPSGGTLYGVYELLERFAGCRWYASWHTVAPARKRIEVPKALDDTQVPAFAMREPYWFDVLRHPEFAARLRVNNNSNNPAKEKFGGCPFRFGGGLGSCHTFEALLPPDKYYDAHPEYYSLVGGKRQRERWQPCLTNPDVLRIVTSNVLERIRKDPGAKFYGVSQNDWYNFCECPSCKTVDDEEESHAGTMIRFVNAVAEEVEKEFPNAIIETLAYQYTRKPPKKTRLRRNVVPCLCTIECDFSRPIPESPYSQNASFMKDIEGWAKQTDQLYVWDYTTDFLNYTMPFPNVHALQGNIKFFRDSSVKELFEQGAYQGRHADFAELKAWLLAKWMWNPDLPAETLLDDFFSGYYGKAAPYVRAWFDTVHSLQLMRSLSAEHPLRIFDDVPKSVIPDAVLDMSVETWKKAVEAVKGDPAASYNVRMAAFSFDYLRLERMRPRLGEASEETKAEAKRLAQSLLDRLAEAKDIRLAESYDRSGHIVWKWRQLVAPPDGQGK